jgi:hypothetical protein
VVSGPTVVLSAICCVVDSALCYLLCVDSAICYVLWLTVLSAICYVLWLTVLSAICYVLSQRKAQRCSVDVLVIKNIHSALLPLPPTLYPLP